MLSGRDSGWWNLAATLLQLLTVSILAFVSRWHGERQRLPRTPLSDRWLREHQIESSKRGDDSF